MRTITAFLCGIQLCQTLLLFLTFQVYGWATSHISFPLSLSLSHPARSLSITIFCRPEEIPQPASIEGEATCSEDTPGAIICTLDGLDRAAFTSRRILGSGPSLEAVLWKRE